eukprot:364786-Chlamydomonas_euryale.AAC.5
MPLAPSSPCPESSSTPGSAPAHLACRPLRLVCVAVGARTRLCVREGRAGVGAEASKAAPAVKAGRLRMRARRPQRQGGTPAAAAIAARVPGLSAKGPLAVGARRRRQARDAFDGAAAHAAAAAAACAGVAAGGGDGGGSCHCAVRFRCRGRGGGALCPA